MNIIKVSDIQNEIVVNETNNAINVIQHTNKIVVNKTDNTIKVIKTPNNIVLNKTENNIQVVQRTNKIIVQNVGIQGPKGDGTIVSINTLEEPDQFIEIGTTGNDIDIVSAIDTHTINIPTASATKRGALSSTDWAIFNSKQTALGFTPENVANKATTFATINDALYPSVKAVDDQLDLKVDRINIAGNSLGSASQTLLVAYNAQGQITSASQENIQIAQSQVDNLTTNLAGKEPIITAGTTSQYYRGDKTFQTLDTSVVPENTNLYFTESRTRSANLTGLNITGGSISSSDSILNAFGKVQNQINGLIGGALYQGVWNATTNLPALTSSVGTAGYYYIVNVAGSTNLNGITDWKVGDWAIFDGAVWQKVDNTDAVSSVNGYTGAVDLTLSDVADSADIISVLGYTPVATSREITINGITQDLSANRSWTISTMVYPGAGIPVSTGTGWGTSITNNSANWDTAYTNRITSLTTTGSNGASTLVSNVLNIPNYTLAGLGGTTLATVNAQNLSVFAPTTSAQLAGVISDKTGTGSLVFSDSPIFTTPNIGSATGSISGNAATATSAGKWTTARNLAGNSVDGSANVLFSNKFIVQGTSDAGLSGAQFLGSLATGLLKNTTGTGVLSTALAATDYVAPSAYASANGLSMTTGKLLGRTSAGTGAAQEIATGSNLSFAAASLDVVATPHFLRTGDSTLGTDNQLLGDNAGPNITSASTNIIIGDAGASITTGGGNIVIGAGSFSTASSPLTAGDGRNIGIGLGTFLYLGGTAKDNLAVGQYSGFNKTGGNACMYLGPFTQGSSATVSNEIVISTNGNSGNLISGKGANTAFIDATNGLYSYSPATCFLYATNFSNGRCQWANYAPNNPIKGFYLADYGNGANTVIVPDKPGLYQIDVSGTVLGSGGSMFGTWNNVNIRNYTHFLQSFSTLGIAYQVGFSVQSRPYTVINLSGFELQWTGATYYGGLPVFVSIRFIGL